MAVHSCCGGSLRRLTGVPTRQPAHCVRTVQRALHSPCLQLPIGAQHVACRALQQCVLDLPSLETEESLGTEALGTEVTIVQVPAETVKDDLEDLLEVLPEDIREALWHHPERPNLVEVVMDLGRRPEARFAGKEGGLLLRSEEISTEELQAAEMVIGEFGSDNRAGLPGTLHRISAIRSRRGGIVGLTCRVGRAVSGHVDMFTDLLEGNRSVLFLGRPGVGKTTAIRELTRVLSDSVRKRVVIVDTSNEIGGDGDVPHPAIGSARRMQVPDPARQHNIMVEAVENHMPQVIVVDEISTEAEGLACRSIAERGVQLIGTAHGIMLENLIRNPALSELVGGVQSVTLGDDEARLRGSQKTVRERRGPATFQVVVEMRHRDCWVVHDTERSVDALLAGKVPNVQVRMRSQDSSKLQVFNVTYCKVNALVEPGSVNGEDGAGPRTTSNNIVSWAQKTRDTADQDALQAIRHLGLNHSSSYMCQGDTEPLYAAVGRGKRAAAKTRAKKM